MKFKYNVISYHVSNNLTYNIFRMTGNDIQPTCLLLPVGARMPRSRILSPSNMAAAKPKIKPTPLQKDTLPPPHPVPQNDIHQLKVFRCLQT